METKLSILYDVSCGLNYLHSYKPEPIVHRDLSSNNILLVSHKQKLVAKLSDLGVAKAVKADSRATKSVLTKAPGTVDFMPPETLDDNPQYSTSLDIFSYAGIVLHIVNQEWPTPSSQVRRDPQTNVLTALSEAERRQKYLDKMSGPAEGLQPLVVACLNNDPDKRPATAIVVKILEYLLESQKALNNTEISVKSTGTGIPGDQLCFVTLSSGLKKSELLVCYLKAYTKIGRPDAEVQQDIQLKGLGIQPEHCVVEVIDPEAFITPLPAARTLVNGKVITEKTKLCHGYRVLLGNNHFFRLSCPKRKVGKSAAGGGGGGGGGGNKTAGHKHPTTSASSLQEDENEVIPDEEMEIDETAMNYDFAMKEVVLNQLNSDPNSIYQQSMEQPFHDKQDALEQQKVHYERQLAELRDRLQEVEVGEPVTTSPPPAYLRSRSRPIFSPMLEAEWEMENSQRVMDTYFRANTLVREANMLSQALDKDTVLKVIMQIPPSLLSPIVMGEGRYHQAGGNEIAVRVLQRARGTDSVWSMETLEEKVVAMREFFQMQEDEKYPIDNDTTMDPFFDIEQHVLLGVANIFTRCLYYRICHEYDAPIIGPTGKVCGSLKLSLERVLAEDVDGEEDTDTGPATGWEGLKDPEGELLAIGSQIGVKIHVMEATGLPSAYCHLVFGQYKFWGQSDPTTLAPLHVFSPAFGKSDKLFEGELKFDYSQVFTVEVTEDFLDYLENGTLSVEVYGHRRTGFINEQRNVTVDKDGQHRSFPDRCCEVMKNLEMWVGILELNDLGSYVPVSIEEHKDVKTGGVYILRQGQSRRIQVKIDPVAGSGDSPLECSHITSIAIGSVYVRHHTEEPLDSYQDIDLDRLRGKWADALMRRRDYLDKELRKLIEKKGRTEVDTEKEQEFIDQWIMLLVERSALLQPKPGSGVPGAPIRWEMSPGMEPCVTTLYLDLNDDMLTPCDDEDPEAAIATAPLLGEKDDSMINLVLVKNNEAMPEATASWDSSVHNSPGLNRTTATNDRVYAILKVSVMLKHPPGIELVLRKRICLHVIKKPGFGITIMKLFSSISYPTHTQTGVMYEVVTGIPKLEGMFRPPKIPSNHPSFVEVEENENVVEKFKEGMMSVRNVLALDRLKQEVCLKEKLAKSGQLLHPAHNVNTVDEEAAAKVLVLRKRICLHVIKKPGFGITIMKLFSSISYPTHTQTGVMYEVVTGIPKLEGMFRPPKIPSNHPSFVEVEENENVVEKFKEGMMSVRNVLALDRLKQEVCLKEKLAKSGQLLHPAHNVNTVDEEAAAKVNSNQLEDTVATPPPQEEFPNQTLYPEDKHSANVGPDPRVIQDSPVEERSSSSGTEEHRPISTSLDIPAINVTVGTLPLTISETTAIVEQNEITEDITTRHSSSDNELPLDDHVISLADITSNNTAEQPTVKRQGSERLSRSNHTGRDTRRRARSSERPSSESSVKTRTSNTPSSERLSRRSIDVSSLLTEQPAKQKRGKSPERRNIVANKSPGNNSTISETVSSDSEDYQAISSSLVAHKKSDNESKSIASSNSLLSSLPTAEEWQAVANDQPPCTVGEKVMVDTPNGFKFGKVKFVGSTEFAAGEWIGVALERPAGKHDGTVKGVKYFKCKNKHGLFVHRDKIIRDPSITGLPNQTAKTSVGSSPHRRKVTSSLPLSKRRASKSKV